MDCLEFAYKKPAFPIHYNYPKSKQKVLWRDGVEVWENLNIAYLAGGLKAYTAIIPGGKRVIIWARTEIEALDTVIRTNADKRAKFFRDIGHPERAGTNES